MNIRATRLFCTSRIIQSTARKSISIVGSGPSGFYTAYRLLSKSDIPLKVTLWEKLPVPYGLARYGVAPDHPEVKNCEDTFADIANQFYNSTNMKHEFQFIGNVNIGKDIKLKELIDTEDSVVLAYGCTGDRKLGIKGEETTKGVFSSRHFVNWYNGHPDYSMAKEFLNFDWSRVKSVGIIGNGNVALDLSRILLSCNIKELWDSTDVSTIALNCLRKAPIENLKIIARRDFVHSKFTNKELRELWELEKYGIFGKISLEYFNLANLPLKTLSRPMKRTAEMCYEYLKPYDQRSKNSYKKAKPLDIPDSQKKIWELDYLKSPIEINSDNEGNVKSLLLQENMLTEDNRVIPIEGKTKTMDVDLLITSLGYLPQPLDEFKELNIKFNKNHLINDEGRVQSTNDTLIDNLYASGWIKYGSKGVIASTMMDAFNVADTIINDLKTKEQKSKKEVLLPKESNHITWKDWSALDRYELQLGKQKGKTRVKVLDAKEMLSIMLNQRQSH